MAMFTTVCTTLARDGEPRRGCRRPNHDGSSRSRPSAYMYLLPALCSAISEANRLVHSSADITVVIAELTYRSLSAKKVLPSWVPPKACTLEAPIPPTAVHVVKP